MASFVPRPFVCELETAETKQMLKLAPALSGDKAVLEISNCPASISPLTFSGFACLSESWIFEYSAACTKVINRLGTPLSKASPLTAVLRDIAFDTGERIRVDKIIG